jgi:DNA-binding transcriptional MerR regulator
MLRIGELSRRSGVSPELLRAWERRYGLLQPTRSDGGLRLYSADDLERVLRMRGHLAAGLAAAEAAALAQRPDAAATPAPPLPEGAGRRLAAALDRFDEPEAQAIFDRLLATATVESVVVDVVLPYLRELGARWERGEASIAQEHFASAVLRGRLLGLARGWGLGVGPLALLACVPGEQHELGLIAFGLILRARGWRIAYLGADTPIDTVERTAQSLRANVVVLAAVEPGRLEAVADDLRALAAHVPLALGGPGAAAGLGARVLDADLAAAADSLIG